MGSTSREPPNRPRWTALGEVYIAPPPGPSHRAFGLTVGGVLAAIALFSWWRGHSLRAEILAALGAPLILVGAVRPASLAPLAAGWSRIGHALGWFNSRVLLTMAFALVIWPIAILGRLFGNDPLSQRRTSGSLWIDYPARLRDLKHFERLF
jgi:saxitoxin biosynthesis operon SxtJ-like protein